MKKWERILLTGFAIVLIFGISVPTNADILSSSKVTATIDSQLQSLFKDASADKRIPVDVWLYETSTVEEREQKIFSKIGISKAQITADTKGTLSSKQVDEYIMTERSMYAEERVRQYAKMRLEYSNVQGLQEKRQADTRLFYSQYAPMISAELTSAEIKLLAQDSRVQSISYSPSVILEDESDVSIPTIGADYVRDTLSYTGSGIKIGMIESTLPDKNADYFISDNIHCDPAADGVGNSQWHANTVAFIMVGQETTTDGVTYKGIVPDAHLYATAFKPYEDKDWRAKIEWLISQGVHIINMSAGIREDSGGRYGEHERWVDHIANDHYVHFVKSVGNTQNAVTSPGLAYNILTIGAIDDKNNGDETDDVLFNQSAYLEYSPMIDTQEEPTNKPDLVAPGVEIFTPAYLDGEDCATSGTSYAAPHVTAVIAQLCQRFPSLIVLQAGVKAMLTASVSHSARAYTPWDDEYDQFGAGVVNARAVLETANAYRMMVGNFPAGSLANAERVYTFTAAADQRVRVSLTWLKNSAIPNNVSHPSYEPLDYDLADLDLYVIHPAEADATSSYSVYNNTEIVDFVTPTAGTYQMVVINRLATEQTVNYGLAWWFGAVVGNN